VRSTLAAACRRELPWPVIFKARQLDQLEHRLDASHPFLPRPPRHLERKRDVLCDGSPVVEDGILEDDPVVAILARLPGRLAVDDDLAAGRVDQVTNDPQERRLATT